MFTFQELGAVLRFVFVFGLNTKKKKAAYQANRDEEDKKDMHLGVFLIIGITLALFIYSFVF